MKKTTRTMAAHKHVALVAHDNCKGELLRWVQENKEKITAPFSVCDWHNRPHAEQRNWPCHQKHDQWSYGW